MVILESSLENKYSVCSTSCITVNLGSYSFKRLPASYTFEAPSNITIYDDVLVGSISFICFKNWLQINVPYFLFPSAKLP